jgi:hypothetical protein
MSIDEVYKTIQFIVRKNSTGGLLDPDQFNRIINRAQMTKFMRSYGNEQEYQPGKPIPRIAFQITQSVTDELKAFIENGNLILDSDGQVDYPDDYVHAIPGLGYKTSVNNSGGIGSTLKYVPIEIVDSQFEYYRLSSQIVNPTRTTPMCVFKGSFIQFYPNNIGPVFFPYLREPRQALWDYTIVNGRPVYNAATSVDLEWPDVNINAIIALACSYIGISIQSDVISQYASQTYQTGV